ncbi:FIST C domain-containing protein [Emticicia oligotrophica DSM 17448]|uniref:FIST C domain-containing protein n=1 Tax=Emticicia oligotrophica (strain DSM 17448 / CIP 109782 / MTCC 6937 / GPTSA100-15) TaxID=929562 RepID=A0ABM5N618_EMTOG|nr:FIST C-terminal domain-containing protein [Emticicia oligotrophica]AFK04964.1 FIST C domain-containing protein [Emticicia oligotrophica DSM 17448]
MYFESIADLTQDSIENLKLSNNYVLVFMAEKTAHEANQLIALLNDNNLKFFGGIYPTLIHNTENYYEGFVLISIPNVEQVVKFSMKDDSSFRRIENLEGIKTAILLMDAMVAETDLLLKKVYGLLNSKINLVGGGAGFMSFEQKPCIFTNEGMFDDGALLILLSSNSKIGVKHGWEVFAGPFIATSTEKNIIKELNWRPAFEVYKEVIESNSNNKFSESQFIDIAKIFPFGIYKEGAEFVVRDPIAINENNEIICISEVPENSTLQILTGDPEKLIDAASEVANQTFQDEGSAACLMVFDCITRVMYLEDQFTEELKAMKDVYSDKLCKIRGVSTLGEIASSGTGFVDFYNKTIVASSIYK